MQINSKEFSKNINSNVLFNTDFIKTADFIVHLFLNLREIKLSGSFINLVFTPSPFLSPIHLISYFLKSLIKSTNIFCSANLLAMQARMPWLKGRTRYGLIFGFWPSVFSQRSGINSSGFSKYFSDLHEMKFCVTIIV